MTYIALPHTIVTRLFCKIAAALRMLNNTCNVFEVRPSKENGRAVISQVDAFWKVFSSLGEKEKIAVEVRERAADIEEYCNMKHNYT